MGATIEVANTSPERGFEQSLSSQLAGLVKDTRGSETESRCCKVVFTEFDFAIHSANSRTKSRASVNKRTDCAEPTSKPVVSAIGIHAIAPTAWSV